MGPTELASFASFGHPPVRPLVGLSVRSDRPPPLAQCFRRPVRPPARSVRRPPSARPHGPSARPPPLRPSIRPAVGPLGPAVDRSSARAVRRTGPSTRSSARSVRQPSGRPAFSARPSVRPPAASSPSALEWYERRFPADPSARPPARPVRPVRPPLAQSVRRWRALGEASASAPRAARWPRGEHR